MFLLQDESNSKGGAKNVVANRLKRQECHERPLPMSRTAGWCTDGTVNQLATARAATKLQWGSKNIVGSNICNASVEGV